MPIDGQPDARQVQLLGQPVPAEDPQAEERRLQEERQQAFDGQRRAEDVADEPAVVAPVHAELELLDDAGDHAHGEVDQEELAPELGHPQVAVVAGADPGRLHARDQQREADRQRHEQEVVDGRDRELPACEIEVHRPSGRVYDRCGRPTSSLTDEIGQRQGRESCSDGTLGRHEGHEPDSGTSVPGGDRSRGRA